MERLRNLRTIECPICKQDYIVTFRTYVKTKKSPLNYYLEVCDKCYKQEQAAIENVYKEEGDSGTAQEFKTNRMS